jgi:DNA-directed RNA polymerase specialized sigma24 family protein
MASFALVSAGMSELLPPRESAGPRGLFPTTRWTIVRELADGVQRVRFIAWDQFVIAYQRPLLLWMTGQCGNVSLAEELVQSFLVKIQGKEHAILALDASKGRLRAWLLVSLQRHWIDYHRRQGAAGVVLTEELVAADCVTDETYDREWALSIARRVLIQLRDEHAARGTVTLFTAFLEILDSPEMELRASWCERLEIMPNTFNVALMRFRERLLVRLREEVAATIMGNHAEEIDSELRYLVTILSRNAGLACLLPQN